MVLISRPDFPAVRIPAVRIETHGCKLNMADSQRMAREFLAAGFVLDPDGDGGADPDVYVLNSCTVTHVADRKARHAFAAARRAYPAALIVASGCYPERSQAAVDPLEAVDLVVTNRDKPRLVERVAARLGMPAIQPVDGSDAVAIDGPRHPSAAASMLGRTRAFIKIQEGCDQVCAYCIVPRVRGRERSVAANELVAQVRAAVDQGVREVVLTGTQLGTYGFDLPGGELPRGALHPGDHPGSLTNLLARLLTETDIPRVRVSSLQPPEMTDELLALWQGAGRGRLCPHFHMPLQSGSDRVLARMRRRYTSNGYLDAVMRARHATPGAAITTDVIAGFPGETLGDFEATLDVVRAAALAGAHVFPYSARPGTSAARFGEQVPPGVRAERAVQIRVVAEASGRRYREAMVGQVRPVLWETASPVPAGLTDNYVRVQMAGRTPRVNHIEEVRLVAAIGDHLVGQSP
jgi:threonylcarbamoyladenosine tRNA methylthiotransferase MtaB